MLDQAVKDALNRYSALYEARDCEPDFADTAAYCEKYDYPLNKCANTILVAGKDNRSQVIEIVACVVLANDRLDINKKIRKLLGSKKASFASAEQTTKLTGMKIGGVGVFGLPSSICVLVDQKVMSKDEVIMGGGNRTSKIIINPEELDKLPNVQIVDMVQ